MAITASAWWRARIVVAAGLLLAACASPAQNVAPTAIEVVQIELSLSNSYLLKGAKPVLIDSGSPKDMPALVAALRAHNLAPADIALVVQTHGHSDHAGLAADIRRAGKAQIALGKGDVPMAEKGDHGELNPQGLTARFLKSFVIDPRYAPFTPDIAVDGELDLKPWGVPGKAVTMPGHTPGAVVVVLDDGRAFVGDMMLGGYLGGALRPHHAGEHYFQADAARNRQNIQSMLKLPVRTFYLGHGGPVTRDSVVQAFGTQGPAAP